MFKCRCSHRPGAPDAKAMPVFTKARQHDSRSWRFALHQSHILLRSYRLIALMSLEVQKLAYFLQESGEPLRLKYIAHTYGPYADNLNKVLQAIEGHFTRGYGDSPKPDREIELLPGAIEAADEFLAKAEETSSRDRLQKVAELIEGFETPYGMELLASVHWVARHNEPPAKSVESAVEAVHSWNDRKRKMFPPKHIAVSWRRLGEAGCLVANG